MDNFDPANLCFGDVLLYFTKDIVDLMIAEKTGMEVGHVERYFMDGQSFASRNGVGVNQYPLRLEGLVCVRRPKGVLDIEKGIKWFNECAKGKAYDFKGLLTFTSFIKSGDPNDMFCSEFSLNFDRACGFEPFNPSQRADHTSPRDLWICGAYETIWKVNENY